MMKIIVGLASLLVIGAGIAAGQAQPAADLNAQIADYVRQHQEEVLSEFKQFLSIPNIAGDSANIQRNAETLKQMLQKRGLKAELLEFGNASPIVIAEMPVRSGRRTVTFYAHYDGQPVQRAGWPAVHRAQCGTAVQIHRSGLFPCKL
jgi:hypothetical protein